MSGRPSSLVARVAWLTAAWALPAALATALVLVAIYRRSVERDFDAILAANLNTLVAGTQVSDAGTLDVTTSLGLGELERADRAQRVEPHRGRRRPARRPDIAVAGRRKLDRDGLGLGQDGRVAQLGFLHAPAWPGAR